MAFDSTQQALRAEMLMEYMDMDVDTYPTPKEITAGCALSIRFPAAILEDVTKLITTESVVIRGIFEPVGEGYICVWPEDGGIE
ncbi:DUF3343 domain-containing protein [Paenibacillus sp. ACRRX]|uniref:DUF3343 domain-containing protein n=1 Tax=unclassified Paenibacillus TaxID=185978 RepID=UPI001EF54059|nr:MULTISPECIES: DUF3343 domain-containing protein [unclassified Paenibacillus]MCG7408378.1 DUF3343 domain-containing protein [Paenibacillus sp. ACRRX]MDK8181237.1 DUF3343 domain-containing protein [Paenibacillus sp. UMB4589-SE434]